MDMRKIQKVGSSTLSISLPKDWVKLAGVKRGDSIYINQEKDGGLKLLSGNLLNEESKPKEYCINCEELAKEPSLLERLVVGSYILGVDVVKIHSSARISGQQIEEVRNIVQKLIGFSIIEESGKEIILQCSIDPLKIKIRSLIQRQSIIVSTMLDEAMEALFKLDPELAGDVIKREDEANNIHWLAARLLLSASKSQTLTEQIGLDSPFDPTSLILVSRSLEGIADCSENLAKIALELCEHRDEIKKEELEKILPLEKLTGEIFRKVIGSLFSGDIIAANEALHLRTKLGAEVEARTPKAVIPYFRPIAIMLSIVAERCASIATTAINVEISRFNSFPHPDAKEAVPRRAKT